MEQVMTRIEKIVGIEQQTPEIANILVVD